MLTYCSTKLTTKNAWDTFHGWDHRKSRSWDTPQDPFPALRTIPKVVVGNHGDTTLSLKKVQRIQVGLRGLLLSHSSPYVSPSPTSSLESEPNRGMGYTHLSEPKERHAQPGRER